MVFDPADAPKDRKHFLEWYKRTTEWAEGHNYSEPAATTPALQAWYEDIRKSFRNMNGPGAPTDADFDTPGIEDRLAGYTIGHHAIYADFRWTVAEEAYAEVRRLAVAHKVGFYDVSGDEGDGEIYFPGDRLRPACGGTWRETAKQIRELQKQ